MIRERKAVAFWLAVGVAAFLIVPWYSLQEWSPASWARELSAANGAPAILQCWSYGKAWLLPIGLLIAAGFVLLAAPLDRHVLGNALMGVGALGFAYTLGQGFLIGTHGWSFPALVDAFSPLRSGQGGMGLGAALTLSAFAMMLALGAAMRGYFGGDGFIVGSAVAISASTAIFTFFPVVKVLLSAFADGSGSFSAAALASRWMQPKVWGLGCLTGAAHCGVAWNTLILALLTASLTTALGLAFALTAARTAFRFKRLLRILSTLPIVTPPFVIGLSLILLFGRSGSVNQFLEWLFGVEPSRWLYGLPGLLLAQVLSFTPIAFLVIIGVVEGLSPTIEEAAQTLRASRWRVFADVSLPLMRPGLANAFLIGFIESIADFGNPIVLGGNFGVLATEVYFSVVGAQLDQGRAAALGIILLVFALVAFFAQRKLLGRRAYTTVAGKGHHGHAAPLPGSVRTVCYAVTLPWIFFTVVVYAMVVVGGFVEQWGRNYAPTLTHYARAFGVEFGARGLLWVGTAWNSFWTTVELSAIAAPVTAALGLLTAYILTRHRFRGQTAFEFGAMLSFAIPGTVIGVSYILAFNAPPIEITGTALILVLCNVFRNMPVGVRAGMASMAQIDASLDEASTTLRARGFTTLRRVVLPLLRPALVAALVYSFVRAVTSLSAIVFLVSAEYEWATTYIVNRVTNGDYGVAIAYSTLLIALMLFALWLIQRLVMARGVGRREGKAAMGVEQWGTGTA